MNRHSIWYLLAVGLAVCGASYTGYHLCRLAPQVPVLVMVGVVLALAFDFTNGVHDAANSIATIVSTRVLTPLQAVVLGRILQLRGGLFVRHPRGDDHRNGCRPARGGRHAHDPQRLAGRHSLESCHLVLRAPHQFFPLASRWLAGAAIAKAGLKAVIASGIFKIAAFIVLSPLIGLVLSFVTGVGMTWLFRNATPRRVDSLFRKGQLVSAARYSLGHGSNDAQKTMGIIALLLYSSVWKGRPFEIDSWIKLICYTAMGLGTLVGGWRIVKTMGSKITKLDPFGGFCAESGAAITLFLTAAAGIPVSTTHTIAGAIVGYGAMRRIRAVRWGMTIDIVWAWILTIPISAAIAQQHTLPHLPWPGHSDNTQRLDRPGVTSRLGWQLYCHPGATVQLSPQRKPLFQSGRGMWALRVCGVEVKLGLQGKISCPWRPRCRVGSRPQRAPPIGLNPGTPPMLATA